MPKVHMIDEQAAIDLLAGILAQSHRDVRRKSTASQHRQTALELLAEYQGVDLERVAWRNTSNIGKSRKGN